MKPKHQNRFDPFTAEQVKDVENIVSKLKESPLANRIKPNGILCLMFNEPSAVFNLSWGVKPFILEIRFDANGDLYNFSIDNALPVLKMREE